MTKLATAIVGTILIVGMTAFSVYQSSTISKQGKTIKAQVSELQFLEESLETEVQENEVLLVDNATLREKVEILRDSIFNLKSEVAALQKQVRKQKKTIKAIKAKQRKMEETYEALRVKVVELARNDESDRELITQLEAEKAELRLQMANLSLQKDQQELAHQQTEQELLDRQVSEARFQRITDIVNNTTVKFREVSARKKRFGRPINRIKKKNSKWRYTVMEFVLEHADLNLLLDERFVVKIVDMDTHEVMSYIESNPNFPNSQVDSKGIEFKYEGNTIELAYYNNQKKSGKNYEVQIFYLSDEGEEYLLLEGTKPFIANHRVMD